MIRPKLSGTDHQLTRRKFLASRICKVMARETIQGLLNREIRFMAKRRLSRGIPIVGAVLGAGFSYIFTKEISTYAYMYYRKRYLKEKKLTPRRRRG